MPHYETGGEGGDGAGGDATGGSGGNAGKGGSGTSGDAGNGTVGGEPSMTEGGAGGVTGIEAGGAGGDGNVKPFHGLYVGPTGDDSLGDGTAKNPFATLAKVASEAIAGDTIVFLDGVYNPFVGGKIADGVDVMAQTSGGVTLVGPNSGVLFSLAGTSRIEGLIAQKFGTVVEFADDTMATGTVTIVDSRFTNCTVQCLNLSGTSKAVVSASDNAVVGDGLYSYALLTKQASLSMVGGVLQNFTTGNVLSASDDAVITLKDTAIVKSTAQALAINDKANVSLDNVTIVGTGLQLITQKGQSKLSITDSDLSVDYSDGSPTPPYHCIRSEMNGVGSIDVTDSKLHHCGNGFTSSIPGALTLTRVQVYDMSNGGIDMQYGSGGKVRITDSDFHDCGYIAMRFGSASTLNDLKIRGTKFVNQATAMWDTVWIDSSASSTVDLGTLAEPGGNTFQSGNANQTSLRNQGTGLYMSAVGNTFIPNQQGADALGHYTVNGAGAKLEVFAVGTGRNYVVPYNGSKILLAQNP